MELHWVEIASAFIVLFAVIDILGSIPIILDMQKKGLKINALHASIISFALMITFLFVGDGLLSLLGVDISSFAIAGSVVIFIVAIEMILGVEIFKHDSMGSVSIVPIAFPLIAGAGTFTTLISLKAEYQSINIIIALTANMVFVYFVLRGARIVERIIGINGVYVLKKFFGIILLAIAVKLFFTNLGVLMARYFE